MKLLTTEWAPTLEWRYHEWIDFTDDRGNGGCEPEAFAVLPHEVVLVEVKLTGCRYGHEQLAGLYVPLLSHIFARPVRALQICRAVNASTPGPFVDNVADFLASFVPLATWHWPGR